MNIEVETLKAEVSGGGKEEKVFSSLSSNVCKS